MAPKDQKRMRNTFKLKSQSNKRLKREQTRKPTFLESREPAKLESLPWQKVEIPTTLEDAEGFFGLEEVDGVEVIRENGRLEFKIPAVRSRDEYSEFEGFDDEPPTPKSKNTKSSKSSSKKKTEDDEKNKICGRNLETKNNPKLDSSKSNAFNVLSEIMDTKEIDVSAWVKLGLSSNLLNAISKLGFSEPTLIQSAAIPEILAGHDFIGKASTGSGKTLAFAVPIVESWLELYEKVDEEKEKYQKPITALILSPTRELAHQLTNHISALCKGLLKVPQVASITGGLSIQKQQRQISKADIVIGTPGRLLDVISSSQQILESIKCIRFLVIDEVDRLLAEGHFKEAGEIFNKINSHHDDISDTPDISTWQTLVFSATFDRELQQKLIGKKKQNPKQCNDTMEFLLEKLNFREKKPKFIDVNPVSQMADNLKEGIIECSGTEKDLYLYALLLYHPNRRTLIFTNSIHSVRRLTPLLQNLGLSCQALHSQMAQKARMRSMERFSSSNSISSILVATDVAARGLDIKGVQLVIHYHLPRTADMYVHRSGRTARAEASGTSILLCAPEEATGIRRLVAKVHVQNAFTPKDSKAKIYLKTLDIDRNIVERLRPRLSLAKKIADSSIANGKRKYDEEWIRTAAQELGVDYDSEEFEKTSRGKQGKSTGRLFAEQESRAVNKSELRTLREELNVLLSQRINVGVNEKYLADGSIDLNKILNGAKGDLRSIERIGLDNI